MKILITNNTLSHRAGTELYVRDVALALQKRGHSPFVYSSTLGEIADEIREAAIPVVHDLKSLSIVPDIIHGQHHLETMTALLHFPKVPAVYFCHGWKPWQEAPPKFSRIFKYVAIDEAVHDRLVFEHGILENRINIVLNFVDLRKFKPREPLPQHPKRALFFSNYASENNVVPIVRKACSSAGIRLDVVGKSMNTPSLTPETLLGRYDLVFARGRSAIEAIAVGAAVILLDTRKTGPMVTCDNLDRLRLLNFGIRTRQDAVNAESLRREIDRYDPKDAALVCHRIRQIACLEGAVDQIVNIYHEVLEEHKKALPLNLENELKEAASYLHSLSPRVKETEDLTARLQIMQKSSSMRSLLKNTLKKVFIRFCDGKHDYSFVHHLRFCYCYFVCNRHAHEDKMNLLYRNRKVFS